MLWQTKADLMPAEERNHMHATDANKEKNKGIEAISPACSYPLETLMALQKILENGLPDAPSPLPRPAALSNGAEKSFQSTFRPQSDKNSARVGCDWKAKLRHWLMKLGKPEEAGKGNSAQQTG